MREVPAPRPQHLFHPKVWVARYAENGGNRQVIRVLCGTRNLTFDASWDTLLRLESNRTRAGPPRRRRTGPSRTISPETAQHGGPRNRRQARFEAIRDLADDLAAVASVPRSHYVDSLHVLGMEGGLASDFPPATERALVSRRS